MSLYNLTDEVLAAAEALECALEWEPDTDADGKPIDGDGNIIADVDAYRAEMVSCWSDTLEGVQLEWEDKVCNVGLFMKSLKSDIKVLEEIVKDYNQKLKRKRAALERVKSYLESELARAGKTKVENNTAMVYIKNNPESLDIADEEAVIKWAQENDQDYVLKYSQPDISKNALKELIRRGESVPGAAIVRTQSLIVK